MKYIEEFRDPEKVKEYIDLIHNRITQSWNIMEICGGQTHSLVKNGILGLLPSKVNMIHGPGCPVCVTPISMIDEALYLAKEKDVILCSFGDMIRVPGSTISLLEAKALGIDLRIVYSPLEAVKLAQENLDRELVFFAVGFETTAPANALSVKQAKLLGLKNFSILVSHVLVPPAMEAILDDPENTIDGFLAAGHVCAIMGTGEYPEIAKKYSIPIVITGFEPLDLVKGIYHTVDLLEQKKHIVYNAYQRAVKEDGQLMARKLIAEVFEVGERMWRGIGNIPQSGYHLRDSYKTFDAHEKFNVNIPVANESKECKAGEVLKGILKPNQCPAFGVKCNPENPLGAPMVSSEGACAAYFHFL
jgi:hydrogenase expression/formation protein HypD